MYSQFVTRRILTRLLGVNTSMRKEVLPAPSVASTNDLIRRIIEDKDPRMVARWGSTELGALLAGRFASKPRFYRSLLISFGVIPDWTHVDVTDEVLSELCLSSGVFPQTIDEYKRFYSEYSECYKEIDVLGSWLRAEKFVKPSVSSIEVPLSHLNPLMYPTSPWTGALSGKKVLVIHPFAKTINNQLARRNDIFGELSKSFLPDDTDFELLAPPQGYGGTLVTEFESWSLALEDLKKRVSAIDFDVALLGCGAYGLPLAYFIKKQCGKTAIHLGGTLQLLFGIKGRRWLEDSGVNWAFNEFWCYPIAEDRPDNFKLGERGQTPYW
jgi:hypothetical protein